MADSEEIVSRYKIALALGNEKIKTAVFLKLGDFADAVVEQAFKDAEGQCQCTRKECDEGHTGRCPRKLKFEDRGTTENSDHWNAHHWIAKGRGGTDKETNCEILCVPCHISTESYGQKSKAT
jgi:HNH endonuclease